MNEKKGRRICSNENRESIEMRNKEDLEMAVDVEQMSYKPQYLP
jgi:hypothetical protein